LVTGGLSRKVTVCDINGSGLTLAGFFEHFPYERIQNYRDKQICISERYFLTKMLYAVFTKGLELANAMMKVFPIWTFCF
jgi:serine kinase of HPr protein (carbohydrate metabolism regulator)